MDKHSPEEISYLVDLKQYSLETYTLKILFGPMYGCELTLPEASYFIYFSQVNNDTHAGNMFSDDVIHARDYSRETTLYIPGDKLTPNMSLHLSDHTEHYVTVYHSGGSEKVLIEENKPFIFQQIRMAIKKSSDDWSAKIFNDENTIVVSDTVAILGKSDFTPKKRALIASMLFITILIICSLSSWFYLSRAEQQASSLQHYLSSAPGSYKLIHDYNNKFYVFTNQHLVRVWMNQALYKLNRHDDVTVVWEKKSREDIINLLRKSGYPVLNVNLDDPQIPQIELYGLVNLNSDTLITSFRKVLPFVKSLDVKWHQPEDLLIKARSGLDKLHVFYREIQKDQGYSFIIYGALNDNTLASLKKFISDYQKDWGNTFISFSVNLNDDLLKDKSYLDAKNGYLFLTPNHWYFPTN